MQNEFDISKYTAFFHDGDLLSISSIKDEVAFQMSSAEVDPSDIEKNLPLSKDHRIQGILHLYNIQEIHLTGDFNLERLFDVFDSGTILDFEIKNKNVELGVLWNNHSPKARTNEFTTIIIKAGSIRWENMPDLLSYTAPGQV